LNWGSQNGSQKRGEKGRKREVGGRTKARGKVNYETWGE